MKKTGTLEYGHKTKEISVRVTKRGERQVYGSSYENGKHKNIILNVMWEPHLIKCPICEKNFNNCLVKKYKDEITFSLGHMFSLDDLYNPKFTVCNANIKFDYTKLERGEK